MSKQMQRNDRFSAEDFFENYEEEPVKSYQPYTQGSLAVEVDYPEYTPERPAAPAKKVRPKQAPKTNGRIRKVENMARIKSKFSFFLCAGLVMAGCLSVVLMYVQVFSRETQISELQEQLRAAQEANAIAQETVADQITMADLYSYATGTLGMVEANGNTTIQVTVSDRSYTTSSLPIQDTRESKVTFHWFG